MSQSVVRILGLSLAIVGCVATVYCGVSVCAQTSTTQAGSIQAPTGGISPSGSTPLASAQTPVGAASTTASSDKDGIKSDTAFVNEQTGVTTCRNWTYTRGDTVITGVTARFDRKADTLDTDDPIVMDDPKHHLTADKAHVEHVDKKKSERTVVLTGHAVMVLKPERTAAAGDIPPAPVLPPGSADRAHVKVVSVASQQSGTPTAGQGNSAALPKDAQKQAGKPPVEDKDREDARSQQRHGGTITCDRIEYKTARKFATITGHVVFKQRYIDKDGKQIERTMTCEHAENDGKSNTLHLFKPVHFEDKDGQTGDSPDDVIVGTKEGEENLAFGHTTIHFTSPDEDEDDAESKESTPKAKKSASDKGAAKTTP